MTTHPPFSDGPLSSADQSYAPREGWTRYPEWTVWRRYRSEKLMAALRTLYFQGVREGFYHYVDPEGRTYRIKTDARLAHEHALWRDVENQRLARVTAQLQQGVDHVAKPRKERRIQWLRFWGGLSATLAVMTFILAMMGGDFYGVLSFFGVATSLVCFFMAADARRDLHSRIECVDRMHPPVAHWVEPGSLGDRGDPDEVMFFSPTERDEQARAGVQQPVPAQWSSGGNLVQTALLGYTAYGVHRMRQDARRGRGVPPHGE